MKTIADLKVLIHSHDGELKIGSLRFTHQDGEDIDIHLDGDLVAYLTKDDNDETNLTDVELMVMDNIKRGREALSNERKIKKELEEANEAKHDALTAIGKVEAYEKLLLGRTITISA